MCILNWLEMKLIFLIYVGLRGMIGAILVEVIDNLLWIKEKLGRLLRPDKG